MGMFDKMFGRGATAASETPNVERRFAELKTRYAPVLVEVQRENVRLENLHVERNKLFLRGVAPSEAGRDRVLDRIRRIGDDDIVADIRVESSATPAPGDRRYTVKAGDSLAKIAQTFYGESSEYMRIFYANRDQLSDPDVIKAGQTLVIPDEKDE